MTRKKNNRSNSFCIALYREYALAIVLIIVFGIVFAFHRFKHKLPIISVIMPVYNTAEYLPESISGVLSQTFTDFELILVNDGSTDNSLDIMQKFALRDKRIKIVNIAQNSGAGAARNEGIKHITGKYTLFIDSDDLMFPTMLEKMYNQAQKLNLDMTMALAYAMDSNSKEMLPLSKVDLDISFLYNYLQEHNISVFSYHDIPGNFFQISRKYVWDKLIKTSVIQDNHLQFDNIANHNDSFFITMAMLNSKRIGYITDRVYLYRANRQNAITTNNADNMKSVYLTFVRIEKELENMGLLEKLYASFSEWGKSFIPPDDKDLGNKENYRYKSYLVHFFKIHLPHKLQQIKTAK